jgi:hypothetical protein
MKNRAKALTVAAILALLAAAYLWGPAAAPLGQERLTLLSNTNFESFQNAFDGDSDAPRMVLLLSPT